MKKRIVICLGMLALLVIPQTTKAHQIINNPPTDETFSLVVNQTKRTKISDGIYLVQYGNVQVIEDDNKQMSIRIEVKDSGKKDSKTGEAIYDLFCNNKFVKSVNIWLLSEAISAAMKATVWGAAVPSAVVKIAVGTIYESICEYYR